MALRSVLIVLALVLAVACTQEKDADVSTSAPPVAFATPLAAAPPAASTAAPAPAPTAAPAGAPAAVPATTGSPTPSPSEGGGVGEAREANRQASEHWAEPIAGMALAAATPALTADGAMKARGSLFTFQRTYPFGSIPPDGRHKAWDSRPRDWIQTSGAGAASVSGGWSSIGPTPTAYPAAFGALGSVSGRIEAIAISPENPQLILIGGSVGGIWRSTDGGGTFTPVTDDQVDISVGGIAFAASDPSVVYAGMGNQYERYVGGVLKSIDAGLTWAPVSNNTLPLGTTAKIEVDPTDPAHVYLAQADLLYPNGGLSGSGFYVSSDGGINWTQTISGNASALLLHPTRPHELYLGLPYNYEPGGQPGLYKSTDGGRTWSLILGSPYPPNELRNIQPAISAASPNRIYAVLWAGTGDGDVRTMVSADGGQTWTNNGRAGWPLYDSGGLVAYADPVNADTIYAGYQELVKSTDGGVSYTSLTPGLYSSGIYGVHVDHHSWAFLPTDHNTFYVGTDGGLWNTSDGGATFHNLNSTLSLTMFYGIAVHPTDPFLVFGGTQDNGIQRRTGTTWDQLRGGDFGQIVVNPLNPSMFFNREGSAVDRWVGDIPEQLPGPAAQGNPGEFYGGAPLVGNATDATIYLGTWRLWVSTDLGDTWSKPAGEFDLTKGNGDVVSAIGVSRSNTNVIYTGSAQGRAMVSTDGGVNWTDISIGLPDRSVSSVTVDRTNPAVAFITVSGYGSGHVFKTTTTGATWTDVSANLPNIPTSAFLIDPLDASLVYAGTDIGVFVSPSGGKTWYTFNSGMPAAVVTGFAAQSSGLIRLSTYGRGMYELKRPPPCATGDTTLCLSSDRFQVRATFSAPGGQSGQAHVVQLTPDTGYLWFFDSTNVEAVVKILNGCALNNDYWVFAGGLTNVNVVISVTDTFTGLNNTYTNPSGTKFQPVQDTSAFPTCSASTRVSSAAVEGAAQHEVRAMRALVGQRAAAPSIHTEGGFTAASTCPASSTALCLNNGRFEVTAHFDAGGGNSGTAQVVQLTSDTGYLWFFDSSNVEAVVKVLNGCGLGGHYWVFAGGLTNVNAVMTVTDTQSGTQKRYTNPANTEFEPIQDTSAFSTCP